MRRSGSPRCPPWKWTIVGDGMHTLGVRLVVVARNSKSASWIGSGVCRSGPTTDSRGGVMWTVCAAVRVGGDVPRDRDAVELLQEVQVEPRSAELPVRDAAHAGRLEGAVRPFGWPRPPPHGAADALISPDGRVVLVWCGPRVGGAGCRRGRRGQRRIDAGHDGSLSARHGRGRAATARTGGIEPHRRSKGGSWPSTAFPWRRATS